MPVDRAKRSLTDLASFGLLRVQTGEETSYSISHRGLEFLDAYWKLAGFLKFLEDESRLSEGERKLAAVMFTDMVGYTSLSEKNETLAMRLLEEQRKLVRPFLPRHKGKEIKTIGDAFLVEFSSAVEAIRCAFDMQRSMHELNSGRSPEDKIMLRIGIHLGDVIHRQDDIYGDAVNVASRIEPLADPEGICITQQVFDQIRRKVEFPVKDMGPRELKNVEEKLQLYKVVMPWEQA